MRFNGPNAYPIRLRINILYHSEKGESVVTTIVMNNQESSPLVLLPPSLREVFLFTGDIKVHYR